MDEAKKQVENKNCPFNLGDIWNRNKKQKRMRNGHRRIKRKKRYGNNQGGEKEKAREEKITKERQKISQSKRRWLRASSITVDPATYTSGGNRSQKSFFIHERLRVYS